MLPTFVRFRMGKGGFLGELHMAQPGPGEIESLPRLGSHKRPVYIILSLFVHPLRRGKGWARGLLHQAVKFAGMNGAVLYLYVKPFADAEMDKAQLQSLYRRAGFQRVATTDESWYVWVGE